MTTFAAQAQKSPGDEIALRLAARGFTSDESVLFAR